MLEIRIKYHEEGLEPIAKLLQGDWLDLRCAKTVEMKAGEFKLIPLGVSMKLPDGYEAHVLPRSSTFKNWGILQANSMGVIDNSYSGDNDQWFFPAYATRDVTINKNDRICQFRLMPVMEPVRITVVDHLDDTDRGGIGSTGKN